MEDSRESAPAKGAPEPWPETEPLTETQLREIAARGGWIRWRSGIVEALALTNSGRILASPRGKCAAKAGVRPHLMFPFRGPEHVFPCVEVERPTRQVVAAAGES